MADKTWRIIPPSNLAGRLAHEAGISIVKAQLLVNRNVKTLEALNSFLAPRLSDLENPMLLKDMDAALDCIMEAVKNGDPVAVFGDYDADGITAAALICNFFSDIGIPVSYYIPDRLNEGYSLNPSAVNELFASGIKLVITVDCGISNTGEIRQALSLGMKVVVTDHHQVPDNFDPACPVINPNRQDSSFLFRELAGVGVAFFLAAAIRSRMRETGWFTDRKEPDLRDYLDLVALGTVADMVPLVSHNRIMVLYGLEVMKNSRWPGIRAIKKKSGIDDAVLSSADLAFKMSPRLNAAGRIGDSSIGIRALTTESDSAAMEAAEILNSMNSERQKIETKIFEQIDEIMLSEPDLENRRTIVLAGQGWHVGVLGIVASRILEKYHRPTVLLAIDNGLAKGSGRSIDGYNLYKSMTKLGHLFEKFGGHYHAAGCTLKVENIEKMAEGLEAIAHEKMRSEDFIPSINIDAEISLDALTHETVCDMRSLAPFGSGNPEPLFFSGGLEVLESKVVGERHLKMRVRQGQTICDAIGFNLSGKKPAAGKIVDMVHTPEINRWNGYERVQLRITDLKAV